MQSMPSRAEQSKAWLPLGGNGKAQTSTQHQQSKQQSKAQHAKQAKQSKAEQNVAAFGKAKL